MKPHENEVRSRTGNAMGLAIFWSGLQMAKPHTFAVTWPIPLSSRGRPVAVLRRIAWLTTLAVVLPTSTRAYAVPTPAKSPPKDHSSTSDDDDFTLGAEADLNARYLWRGLALSNGPVVEPALWATAYRWNAVLWTNVMLTNEASSRLSAVVPALTYTFEWPGGLTIEPGLVYYDSPGQTIPPSISTAEVSLEASSQLGRFHLVTSDYVDVMRAPGAYFGTLGFGLESNLGPWSFNALADVAWATAAYNQVYFDAQVAAIDLTEIVTSARIDLTPVFYVSVHAEASVLLADALAVGRERILANVGVTFGGATGL